MSPKYNHKYVIRGGRGRLYTHRRESDGKMEQRDLKMLALIIGVIWPQAKGCWQPPENRSKEQILSRASTGSTAPLVP